MSNPIILHPATTENFPLSQQPDRPRFTFKPARPLGYKTLEEIADAANAIASMAISESELRIITAFAHTLGVKLVKAES